MTSRTRADDDDLRVHLLALFAVSFGLAHLERVESDGGHGVLFLFFLVIGRRGQRETGKDWSMGG